MAETAPQPASARTVTRYRLGVQRHETKPDLFMVEIDPAGEWVHVSDVEPLFEAIARLTAQLEAKG